MDEKPKRTQKAGNKGQKKGRKTAKKDAHRRAARRNTTEEDDDDSGKKQKAKQCEQKLTVGCPCNTYKHTPTDKEIALIAKLQNHIARITTDPPAIKHGVPACFISLSALTDPTVVNLTHRHMELHVMGMIVLWFHGLC